MGPAAPVAPCGPAWTCIAFITFGPCWSDQPAAPVALDQPTFGPAGFRLYLLWRQSHGPVAPVGPNSLWPPLLYRLYLFSTNRDLIPSLVISLCHPCHHLPPGPSPWVPGAGPRPGPGGSPAPVSPEALVVPVAPIAIACWSAGPCWSQAGCPASTCIAPHGSQAGECGPVDLLGPGRSSGPWEVLWGPWICPTPFQTSIPEIAIPLRSEIYISPTFATVVGR